VLVILHSKKVEYVAVSRDVQQKLLMQQRRTRTLFDAEQKPDVSRAVRHHTNRFSGRLMRWQLGTMLTGWPWLFRECLLEELNSQGQGP
jgi:hypothetical protein